MERNFSFEKRSEKTTRLTGKTGLPPWYQQYRFQEEPTDNQRPLHGDPRDKHDNDFIPSDDDSDHEYGHPGVGIGPVPDFYASTSFASDQGTLAGGRPPGRPPTPAGIWARKQMGDEQYQLVLDYDRGDTRDAAKNARTRYAKLKRQYNPNMQGSSQQQGEYQWQDYLHTELQGSSQQQGESSPQPNKRYTHITDSGQMIDFDKKDPPFAHIPDRWLK